MLCTCVPSISDTAPCLVYALPAAAAAQILLALAARFPSLLWRFPATRRDRFRLRDGMDIYAALSDFHIWQSTPGDSLNFLKIPSPLLACTRAPKKRGLRNPAIPLLLISSLGGQDSAPSVEVGFVPYSLPFPLVIVLGQILSVCFRRANPPLFSDEAVIEMLVWAFAGTWIAALAYCIERERKSLRAMLGEVATGRRC